MVVPALQGWEPSNRHRPICGHAWREFVSPREMVLGASRQHIDFVTALGEALGGLAHDSLRTAPSQTTGDTPLEQAINTLLQQGYANIPGGTADNLLLSPTGQKVTVGLD